MAKRPADANLDANKKQRCSLEMISAASDKLDHRTLDEQQTSILERPQGLAKYYNPVFLLVVIVKGSPDTLDQSFTDDCKADKLLDEHEGLEQLLLDSWEKRSYADIRRLSMCFQSAPCPLHHPTYETSAFLQKGRSLSFEEARAFDSIKAQSMYLHSHSLVYLADDAIPESGWARRRYGKPQLQLTDTPPPQRRDWHRPLHTWETQPCCCTRLWTTCRGAVDQTRTATRHLAELRNGQIAHRPRAGIIGVHDPVQPPLGR